MAQGVLVDFSGAWMLGARERFEMLRIVYTVTGEKLRLDFCNTLGSPATATKYVVDSTSYTPSRRDGIDVAYKVCPELTMHLAAARDGSKLFIADVPVLLDTSAEQDVSGFQFGLGHDTTDVEITGVAEGAAVLAIGGADFFTVVIVPGGVTAGGIIDMMPDGGDPPRFRVLPACTPDQEIAVVGYTCIEEAVGDQPVTVTLRDDLGHPPVPVTIAIGGQSEVPVLGDPVSFTVRCPNSRPFLRGDATQDGDLNMSDAAAIAKAVFGFGRKLPFIQGCQDSADVNDDGIVDTTDAIFLLEYLFAGGRPIPPPNTCDLDTTPSSLPPCEAFPCYIR